MNIVGSTNSRGSSRRGVARCVMEACRSCPARQDVQLSRSITIKLVERETLASLERRRQKERGAARESGLSRSRRNASKEERCDDVHRKNRHVPVAIQPLREEWTGTVKARTDRRGVYLSCAKCFAAHTTVRRAPFSGEPTQRPGHSWYTIARYVGGGGNCEAEIVRTHSANVWKKSLAEMDEHFSFTEY